jgi:hypothetical protein
MLAVDLLAWTQHLLLDGDLAKAEPKTLRYRLLHVAACLTHGQRRIRVRIQQSRPDHAPLTPGAPGRPASRTILHARSQIPAQTGPPDLQEDQQQPP